MKTREICIFTIVASILIFGIHSNSAFGETSVDRVPRDSHPPTPDGEVTMDWQLPEVKASCYENGEYSQTCPILLSDGFSFWAFSYKDNRSGMMIVKYDDSGNIVEKWEKSGARYLYDISVDATKNTVSFWGQSDRSIVMGWGELGISSGNTIAPPVVGPIESPPEKIAPKPEPDTSETPEQIPAWIKDVFAFYVDGSIDEGALINALQWLINEGIIKLD